MECSFSSEDEKLGVDNYHILYYNRGVGEQ